MARVTKNYIFKLYRLVILILGFLFIYISGCRSGNVEKTNSTLSKDTTKKNNELLPAPEYGAMSTEWEEIQVEEKLLNKSDTTKGDNIKSENKQKEVQVPVKQPSPEPLEPAAAYGTNIQRYSPNNLTR